MPVAQKASETSRSIGLFTIRGIQVRLDYSWFIVFALVLFSLSLGYFPQTYPDQSVRTYWTTGLLATVLFFLSVITHELSHSFMALHSGIKIHEITLFIFGGMARLSEEANDPKTEFKIAVVGPLTSLVLAGLFWLIQTAVRGDQPSIFVEMFGYLAWINVALAVFNLIPGFPLDGGRLFRAFWWWKSGSLIEATRVASDWGKGFAIVLMIFGGLQIFAGSLIGGLWLIFIGMFLRGMAEASYQNLILKRSLDGTRVEQVMTRDVVSVSPDLPVKGIISDYFLRYGYRGFPVRTNGTVRGVVSLTDIKDLSMEEQDRKTVGDVMAPIKAEMIVTAETPLSEALRKMTEENLGRLLVMSGNQMLGMITQTGVLRYLEIHKALSGSNPAKG
ncbi:MAG TPA: site-2 protease family protein [Candidatus Binatia bacterium]|nr:site-2 protease family protein [Candidatus Binatia bacterium]